MLTKVLFTIAVVLAVIFFSRLRRRPGLDAPTAYQPDATSGVFSYGLMRWLASVVVVLMVVGAAFYLYLDWRGASEIVRVRVIDAGTGKSSEYEVYRGEIEDRSFRTVDGRRVILAETERMETSAIGSR